MDPKVIREMSLAYTAVYEQELREEIEYEQSQIEELSLAMIENASYVLFSQGYDVNDVISYFTEATENTIIEDFVNYSEGSVILESVAVSEAYIAEQFQILNENLLARGAQFVAKQGGRILQAGKNIKNALTPVPKAGKQLSLPLGQAGKPNLLQKAAKGAKDLVMKIPGARRAADIGRAAAKTPLGKLGSKVLPGAGAALYGMDAVNRAKKGDWGGAALSGLGAATSFAGPVAALAPAAIQMATDAAGLTGDKSRKGANKVKPEANKAKFNASAALGGQTAFKAGGGAAAMKKDPKLTAADVQKKGNAALRASAGGDLKKGAALFKSKQEIMAGKKASTPAAPSGSSGSSSGSGGSGGSSKPTPTKPTPSKPTPSTGNQKLSPMQQWAKANPTLASKVKQGQSGYDEISKMRDKPGPNEKQDQTPTQGSPTAKIDTSSVESDLKAAQERDKKKRVNAESYVVLSHLLDEGYANTEDAAFVIMANMSEEWRESILSEAPGEWFGGLRDKARASRAAQIQSAKPTPKPLPSTPSPFAKPASRDDSGRLTTYGAGGGAAAERGGQTRSQVMQQGAKNRENNKRAQPVNQGPNFGR